MGEYVMYQDLLHDEYEYKVSQKVIANSTESIITPQPAKYTLTSVLEKGNYVPFNKILKRRPDVTIDVYDLTRSYLDILKNGSKVHKKKNWPKPTSKGIFECLKIEDVDDNEETYEEQKHQPSSSEPSSTESSFTESLTEQVFLCRWFKSAKGVRTHASGMQCIEKQIDADSGPDVIEVQFIKSISRVVHVVPDFSTSLHDDDATGIYDKYLVNHDIDAMHWSYGTYKKFARVPGRLKMWAKEMGRQRRGTDCVHDDG
ncbi:hypothetical protein BJV82DRAFT_676263 [Fennellomyces sp. T-0311]|nr:hypothetical protein BJV82DRAFT_676263 [Fennellomyces sp. T-0311]